MASADIAQVAHFVQFIVLYGHLLPMNNLLKYFILDVNITAILL